MSLFRGLRAVGQSYSRFSTSNGYTCAFLTGGVIVGSGDLICQTIVDKKPEGLDKKRLAIMIAFGSLYTGCFCRFLYAGYDRVLGSSRTAMAQKIFLDTFGHQPFVYIPTFYISTNLLSGRSPREAHLDLSDRWLETTKMEIAIWGPCQSICFTVVPPQYRVLWVSTISFFEKIALSYMANRELPSHEHQGVHCVNSAQ